MVVLATVLGTSSIPAVEQGQVSQWWNPPAFEDIPRDPNGGAIWLGYEIVTDTQQRARDYVGNTLNCRSCHLQGGLVPFAGPFVGAYTAFPEYRARNGKINTLEIRINDCFERSMNGKALPYDSEEMGALVAYMAWLSKGVPSGTKLPERGFPRISSTRPASPENGKALFTAICAVCHRADGAGSPAAPPVWGPQSYTKGAGMARLGVAAAFIQRNMPLGQGGVLTNEDSYDLAAYINSQPRPEFPRRAQAWPNGDKPDDIVYRGGEGLR